jgi:hypothetical protein
MKRNILRMSVDQNEFKSGYKFEMIDDRYSEKAGRKSGLNGRRDRAIPSKKEKRMLGK